MAVPVATGQKGAQPGVMQYLQPSDLDYAVLQVQDDDPGGPIFPLASAVAGKTDDKLQLFQYWTGSFSPAAGKARCADDMCIIRLRTGPNDPSRPELCPNMLQHGCSSEPGASGGPILLRSTLRPVGLHYRGGLPNVFNCALPAATISKLCSAITPFASQRWTAPFLPATIDRDDNACRRRVPD
jgi:hypothetical protein